MVWIAFLGISCEIYRMCMPQIAFEDKSALVQEMAWCHQGKKPLSGPREITKWKDSKQNPEKNKTSIDVPQILYGTKSRWSIFWHSKRFSIAVSFVVTGMPVTSLFFALFPYCFDMITSSNGHIFRVTGPLCGEFTGHRWIPHTKASDAELWCFFDLRMNKRLSKQSWRWWFETLSRPLWRHCNEVPKIQD